MFTLPFPLLLCRSMKGAGGTASTHLANTYLKGINAGYSSHCCDCSVESLLQFNFLLTLPLVFRGYFHPHLFFKSLLSSFWFRLFLCSRWSLNLLLPAYLHRLRFWPCRGQLRVLRLFQWNQDSTSGTCEYLHIFSLYSLVKLSSNPGPLAVWYGSVTSLLPLKWNHPSTMAQSGSARALSVIFL